uniref:dynein regulatory complex protein 9 n=1 Tax=Doryrhamphus excisus TaxID=161450 RepID=UPI0025AE94EC|nr:dynein regulatory complex protein 9 [Doryrhamphus excisus]XP_057909118.1 dynein regulatory complex protein 9 [Doryrhamphus excisus]XP_057909119.1 dynein regulatory complex protein 9 [Doryrhamphus excisus]
MNLSQIQSLRLAAVLEECSDQLDILEHALTIHIHRECSTEQRRARVKKVKRDCHYISQQVSKLQGELEEKQSFACLLQVVHGQDQEKNAESSKREAKKEMEKRRRLLPKQQAELQEKANQLKELQTLYEDIKERLHQLNESNAERKCLEERNIEQQLQRTQNEMREAEKRLEDQVVVLNDQLKLQERIHGESNIFLKKQHQELQEQLRHWQECTEQNMQEKEHNLTSMRYRRATNLEKLTAMQKKYSEMEEVVKEDWEEQERIRQREREIAASIKLQSWWRGCMVRKGFGIYRKVEEKKGKKKKKEGKKKKKK